MAERLESLADSADSGGAAAAARSDARASGQARAMRLRVMLPTSIVVDALAVKIVAEARNGSFCLLPRHVDFVAALTPGILSFVAREGGENFVAIGEGTLVKRADDVLVSVVDAVIGDDLAGLRAAVDGRFREHDEDQRVARSALASLEAAALRRFVEMERGAHG